MLQKKQKKGLTLLVPLQKEFLAKERAIALGVRYFNLNLP
jgi:hypothetical protein